MKVRELIEELKKLDQDLPVAAYNDGDLEVILEVSEVELSRGYWDHGHKMGKIVRLL